MNDYPLRTAEQLSVLLQAFRKESGLTQSEVALRLGVTQQTYSTLERHADSVGVARLLKLLGILGVELVLSKPADNANAHANVDVVTNASASPTAAHRPDRGEKPTW